MSLVPGGGVKKESKMQGPVPTVVVKAGACMKGGGEGGSKKPQKRTFPAVLCALVRQWR